MLQLREPTTQLTARILTDPHEWDALRSEWDALLRRSSANSIMLSHDWLQTWWQTFAADEGYQLRILLFHEDDRLVGIAPLYRRRHWYRPGIPFRRLQFLGTGEPEADSICSDYPNLIVEPEYEERIVDRLAQEIQAGACGVWDEIVLPMMDGSNPIPALLSEAFSRQGYVTEQTTTTEAPYIPLPSTWDAYLAGLSKKYRGLMRRSRRDFDAWAEGDATLERADTPERLQRGYEILIDLHRQRWEEADESGTFRSPKFLAFHERMMKHCLEQGTLHLLWLTVRGESVAAIYSFVWDGKVSFYQCGRRMEVPTNLRVGAVMIARAIEDTIEQDCDEFDFLAGTSVYKKQMALATRPIVELRIARRCTVERLRLAVRWSVRTARRVKGWFSWSSDSQS